MDSIKTVIPEPDENTDIITIELPCCGKLIDIDPVIWRNAKADKAECPACAITYDLRCVTSAILGLGEIDGWRPEVMVIIAPEGEFK